MFKPRISLFGVTVLLAAGALALRPAPRWQPRAAAAHPPPSQRRRSARRASPGSTASARRRSARRATPARSSSTSACASRKRRTHLAPPNRRRPPAPAPAAPAWSDGRWRGFYSDNSLDLLFNVVGGTAVHRRLRLLLRRRRTAGVGIDPAEIAPVEATISPGGDFAGSGSYGAVRSADPVADLRPHRGDHDHQRDLHSGPYAHFYGSSCSGTTHFTGQWVAEYTF